MDYEKENKTFHKEFTEIKLREIGYLMMNSRWNSFIERTRVKTNPFWTLVPNPSCQIIPS